MIRRLTCALVSIVAVWALAPAAAATTDDVQSMIDAAPAGATVTVLAGVHAGAVRIDHPIHLLGAPGATIDGQGVGSVLTIDAPDVEVAGLTIIGSGRDQVGAPSGILLTSRADRGTGFPL